MKKFFKAIGKAILYLLFYFGIQTVVSFVFAIVATVLMMLSGDTELATLESDLLNYTTVILLISNVLSLVLVWLFFVIRKKRFTSEIQLHKCKAKQLLPVAVLGLGFAFGLNWMVEIIPFPESMMESFMTSHDTLSVGNPIINFISVAILTPIVEEVFFRGLIYTRLKSGMPTVIAAILSAALFGLMHGEIVWMIFAFGVGLVLVWVFERTQSLWGCIVVHAVNNGLSQLAESEINLPIGVEWILGVISVVLFVASAVYVIKSRGGEVTE